MIADQLTMRPARSDEAGTVLAVLDGAAAWLSGRGITQWPAAFRPEWIEPGLADGHVWLAESDGSAVATVTLFWSDPLWPDDGRAGYVHRLAVGPGFRGLGATLLDWVDGEVRRHGRDRVRLDCGADNTRLRTYYEAAGFEHRGDVELPEEWTLWSTGRPMLSRYERSAGR